MKAFAKIDQDGNVIDKLIADQNPNEHEWVEMPIEFGFSTNKIKYENGLFEEKKPKTFKEELLDKIAVTEADNRMLKAQLKAQTDRSDFIEDVIAEMATQVYV